MIDPSQIKQTKTPEALVRPCYDGLWIDPASHLQSFAYVTSTPVHVPSFPVQREMLERFGSRGLLNLHLGILEPRKG